MTRPVIRNPEICGGEPTIQGTRLTCSNVVLSLHSVDRTEKFLATFPELAKEDIREAVRYCSEQRCIVDNKVKYCARCTLDHSEPPAPPDAFIQSVGDLEALRQLGELGQVFLGTEEEYQEDVRRREVWKVAAQILPGLE